MMRPTPLLRRMIAETLGSGFLALAVVGSGIAAERLSPNNPGEALGINAATTALALFVIILIFGPLSGAHVNPVISLVDALLGRRPWRDVAAYVPAQIVGCVLGTILANVLFAAPTVSISSQQRMDGPHFIAEMVATAGLVLVVFGLTSNGNHRFVPAAVGAYIGAAYFFASSTSFANPAITIGRVFTDTFTGIAPTAALGFIGAQFLGGGLGYLAMRALGFVKPSADERE